MLVKVWNKNVHPYQEKFRGEWIKIPAQQYIVMDMNDAHYFLGTMPGNIAVDANGIQTPESYKMLSIEKFDGTVKEEVLVKKYACHVCKQDLGNADAYIAHVEEMHMKDLVDEDAVEKMKKKPGPKAKVVKDDAGTD